MSKELKPEVIIVDGYKVDKYYSVEITNSTIITKYRYSSAWCEEQHTYTSNAELQQIVENQLERAFAQGYEVCYQELGKFTKEDVEKAAEAIFNTWCKSKEAPEWMQVDSKIDFLWLRTLVGRDVCSDKVKGFYALCIKEATEALNAIGKVEE
jgi:hypothetical protein